MRNDSIETFLSQAELINQSEFLSSFERFERWTSLVFMIIKARVNESKRNENMSINNKSKCGNTCGKFMNRNVCEFRANCRLEFMKVNLEWLKIFLSMQGKGKGNEKEFFQTFSNYFIMQIANGKSRFLVNLARATYIRRNEYLILEVCHSSLKFQIKKQQKRTVSGLFGILRVNWIFGSKKHWTSHLWIQVEVEIDPGVSLLLDVKFPIINSSLSKVNREAFFGIKNERKYFRAYWKIAERFVIWKPLRSQEEDGRRDVIIRLHESQPESSSGLKGEQKLRCSLTWILIRLLAKGGCVFLFKDSWINLKPSEFLKSYLKAPKIQQIPSWWGSPFKSFYDKIKSW